MMAVISTVNPQTWIGGLILGDNGRALNFLMLLVQKHYFAGFGVSGGAL
jgi:hypothetical protein